MRQIWKIALFVLIFGFLDVGLFCIWVAPFAAAILSYVFIMSGHFGLGLICLLLDIPVACFCWGLLWNMCRNIFKKNNQGNEDCGRGAKNKPPAPVISGNNKEVA